MKEYCDFFFFLEIIENNISHYGMFTDKAFCSCGRKSVEEDHDNDKRFKEKPNGVNMWHELASNWSVLEWWMYWYNDYRDDN